MTRPDCTKCWTCKQGRRCDYSTQITGALLGEIVGIVIAFALAVVVILVTHP